MNDKKIDIIIISYNCAQYTIECIESIVKTANDLEYGIIVVDNASSDNTVTEIERLFPEVKLVVNTENLGYAAAVNLGAAVSDSGYIIVSNADVVYHENSIKTLYDYLLANPRVAAAGPQQIYRDGSWEYSYGTVPGIKAVLFDIFMLSSFKRGLRKTAWGKFKFDKFPRDVEYIDGAVMAIDKLVFDQLSGFDEDYFFYSEEADFCHRARLNYKYCIFHPKSIVTHYRGISVGESVTSNKSAEMMIRSQLLFCKKHRTNFECQLFILLSKFDTMIKSSFWKFMSIFAIGSSKKHIETKAENFRIRNQEWRKI